MEGAVVDGADGEVLNEIDAFKAGICIRAIAVPRRKPALVTKCYQMRCVKRLDICADIRRPIGDDGGGAAVTAGFIAELSSEDCGRTFVSTNDEGNVIFVCGLSWSVGEEGGGSAPKGFGVSIYASEIIPVVEQGENKLEALLFRSGDHIVQSSNTWSEE